MDKSIDNEIQHKLRLEIINLAPIYAGVKTRGNRGAIHNASKGPT